jgi:hypothetical protein
MQRSRFLGVLATTVAIFSCATASALAAAPEAPTIEPVVLEGLTAKLKGALNPGAPGEPGSYEFLYKLSATECEGEGSTGQTGAGGAQEEPVAAEVPGLQPSATYSFCLLARNGAEAPETAVSSIETVTTPAAPPAVDAEGLSSLTGTSAGLAAQINANNQETTYEFEYSTEATGETLEGTIVKVPGAEPLPAVFGDQAVEVKAEPLQPQTTYFWRVVATNAAKETTSGKVETFPTPLPPETPTMEPVVLEGLTAKLKGTLNPAGTPEVNSNYEFRYRLSASECEPAELATVNLPEAGVEKEEVSGEAPLLQPNATYAFCLLARNQVGETALSSVQTIETPPAPPTVEAESSSGMASTVITLKGEINPNNQETTYAFEYSTNENLEGATQVPGASPLPSGFGNQPVETKLEGLAPRTQYFWRITATNATNVTNGTTETFTTFDKPLVTAEAAQAVTRTTAAVGGAVNPGGLSTRSHLVYVEDAQYNAGANECPQEVACAYGENAKTTPSELIGATDYSVHSVGPLGLEELKPGTTYHYTLIATNSEGTRVTSDQTFTTSPATPPSASTGEASGVTQLSATLSGTADTRGLPGTLSFQVALSPEGGSPEPATVSGSGSGTSVSITFSFGPYLQPGTTYYYRAYATNADGTAAGEWRSFTTGTFPSPFTAGPPAIPLLKVPVEPVPPKIKPLTNAQKLKKALKACHKLKKKSKRAKCERQARRKYGPAKHKKK